jgi:hypothetical protein
MSSEKQGRLDAIDSSIEVMNRQIKTNANDLSMARQAVSALHELRKFVLK